MPSFFLNLGITLGAAYVLLDRTHVGALARLMGYGLGRSVGILRNYRQNAERLVKANPNSKQGMMSTMRELDAVAREVRMAVWMARPGAMMRMGPMGGMTITPPTQASNPGMGGNSMPLGMPQDSNSNSNVLFGPGTRGSPASYEQEAIPEGGSDILVSSWRAGTERTRVRKQH